MKSTHKSYNHEDSFDRIDKIIQLSDNSFEERDTIPDEGELTFSNGFYVKCSALFIDIRDSSKLTTAHYRPKLAKLYRVYVSEVIAILNDNSYCKSIQIVGDGISAIFDGQYIYQINRVFSTSAKLSSLIDIINFKFKEYDIQEIEVGIGLDWGRALMVKAGYKGSGINNVVWMGDVVNYAAKLCSYGNKSFNDKEVMVSEVFFQNLNEHNQGLLQLNTNRSCYNGYVIDIAMNNWLQEQMNAMTN